MNGDILRIGGNQYVRLTALSDGPTRAATGLVDVVPARQGAIPGPQDAESNYASGHVRPHSLLPMPPHHDLKIRPPNRQGEGLATSISPVDRDERRLQRSADSVCALAGLDPDQRDTWLDCGTPVHSRRPF